MEIDVLEGNENEFPECLSYKSVNISVFCSGKCRFI